MAKEILLYGDIHSDSAAEFIEEMNEAIDEEIVVRISTDGGDPEYGFGMVAKFAEHIKGKSLKVDGKAYSMGSFFCLYCPDVEALNVSQFLIHRAAYPSWFEADPTLFTDSIKQNLANVNASLRAAFEAKIDVPVFEKLAKKTVDEVFSIESRIDVFLNAKEAKKIGLISSITNITPSKKKEIAARMAAKNIQVEEEIPQTPIKKIMTTLAELKASHPDVYALAQATFQAEGVATERDRVGSWLPFIGADVDLVTTSIKEGKNISATAMSELNVKMFASQSLAAIAGANAKPVVTPEVAIGAKGGDAELEAKQAAALSFRNEARASLNLPLLK